MTSLSHWISTMYLRNCEAHFCVVYVPVKTEVHGVSLSASRTAVPCRPSVAVGDEDGDAGFEYVSPSGSGRKMLSLSSAKYRLCFDGQNTHGRATSSPTVWSRSINRPRSLIHNSKHKRAHHMKSSNSKQPCCLFTKNDCCLLGQIYCTAFTWPFPYQ
jgi:hypothetical protein